jgi:DNA-binding transcriptional LysR family regulator
MLDRQLRYFLICAQECSFTKAAERLNISQSALSQQMREFEQQLQQSLFIRRGRGVVLTAAGIDLQQRVEPCFLELDQALQNFRHRQGVSEGTISIASVHPVLSYLLSNLIADYIRQYPRVNFSLLCGGSPKVVEMVRNRTADLGLIYDNVISDMHVEPLFTERLLAVFSPNLPMAKEILKTRTLPDATPLIMFQSGYSLRRTADKALNAKKHCIRVETETVDSMLNLVRSGAGVCFLPAYISGLHKELHHCELANVTMQVSVAQITKPDVPMQPLVSQLVKDIKIFVEKSLSRYSNKSDLFLLLPTPPGFMSAFQLHSWMNIQCAVGCICLCVLKE